MSCWDKCPVTVAYYKKHPDEAEKDNYVFPNQRGRQRSPDRGLSGRSSCTSNYVSSKDSLDSVTKEKIEKAVYETQKKVDDYILNKGWNYFRDYCNCTYACTFYHLWHDPFISGTFSALILFAIGVKLCYELDGMNVLKQ